MRVLRWCHWQPYLKENYSGHEGTIQIRLRPLSDRISRTA